MQSWSQISFIIQRNGFYYKCTYYTMSYSYGLMFFWTHWQILQFNKLKKIRSDQENLPIFQYRQMILDKLEQNQIVVVAGDTGCGKSTQVGGKGVVKKFNTLCQVISINIAECGNICLEWRMMWSTRHVDST